MTPTSETPVILAGVGHVTLKSWLILALFASHIAAMMAFVVRLWRGQFDRTPYFSVTFFLGLCPLLICNLIGIIRFRSLGPVTSLRYIDNLPEQIEPISDMLLYGLSLSAGAVLIYSVAYLASHRKSRLATAPAAFPTPS